MLRVRDFRDRLVAVVRAEGPIQSKDVILRVRPEATREDKKTLAAYLCNLARQGFIDNLGNGLYDEHLEPEAVPEPPPPRPPRRILVRSDALALPRGVVA